MALRSSEIRTEREPVEVTIGRLSTYVHRMEARYECTTEAMASAAGAGYTKRTAEIARWLAAGRTLNRLKSVGGPGAGTSTTITS